MGKGIRFGTYGAEAVHLCVDMQQLFASGAPWHVPWISRVLPNIVHLAEARAERSIFTRFIPPRRLFDAPGSWGRYYAEWPQVLRDERPSGWLKLVPELNRLTPPGRVFDKQIYSPWTDGRLHMQLCWNGINTVVITGGETDVCVLSTVLGAVDRGYRVIIVENAVCSSSDSTHDAVLSLFEERFSQQIETCELDEARESWIS
jgi:nicotinamidase-related amidase